MPRRARPRRSRSTTSSAASRTTATGTACSAGIYISHMRLATYEHLIAAEDLAETATGHARRRRACSTSTWTASTTSGSPSPGQVVTIDLAEGAGIGGWDIRAVRHALAAVMRRRPEAYHETLRAHERGGSSRRRGGRWRGGRRVAATARAAVLRPRSTTSCTKEPGLADQLHYDPYERRSGLVRFLAPADRRRRRGRPPSRSSSGRRRWPVRGRLARRSERLVLTRDATVRTEPGLRRSGSSRSVAIGGDRRSPDPVRDGRGREHRPTVPVQARLGIEWTLTMLGGGGNPSAWWEVDGERHGARRPRHGRRDVATLEPGQRLHRHRDRHHRL